MYGDIALYCDVFNNMGGWGHMAWPGFPLFIIGVIGIFILLSVIVFFFIFFAEKKDETEVMSDAQKIIDERYAKGEITQKEYKEYKEDLKK